MGCAAEVVGCGGEECGGCFGAGDAGGVLVGGGGGTKWGDGHEDVGLGGEFVDSNALCFFLCEDTGKEVFSRFGRLHSPALLVWFVMADHSGVGAETSESYPDYIQDGCSSQR